MRIPLGTILTLALALGAARAEDQFERPPIEYSLSTPDNAVSRLQTRLEQGAVALRFDAAFGYLPALLKELGVPADSQMLVYSKTSLQRHRITPKTPRAVYFGDEVYVGFCHAGDVLEVSVADPQLGAVFYTLEQKQAAAPSLVRQTHKCLLCHSGSQAGDIPSHLVRSVFVDASGLPILSEGSFRVDQTTPIENRWGGWYVTGHHGKQSHLGNLIVGSGPLPRPVRNETGLNLADLTDRLTTANYLAAHSDIVALMVLEHQTLVHNLITQANFAARQALHYEAEFNRGLGEPADNRLESTSRRIANAGDRLVAAMLFVDEAPIEEPISGSTQFAAQFSERGPRDSRGRSLRDFDLAKRIFKYPCSYLIYGEAFDALPAEMKAYVTTKLRTVLTGSDDDFAHLSADDRRAIWEILSDTKPELFKP